MSTAREWPLIAFLTVVVSSFGLSEPEGSWLDSAWERADWSEEWISWEGTRSGGHWDIYSGGVWLPVMDCREEDTCETEIRSWLLDVSSDCQGVWRPTGCEEWLPWNTAPRIFEGGPRARFSAWEGNDSDQSSVDQSLT